MYTLHIKNGLKQMISKEKNLFVRKNVLRDSNIFLKNFTDTPRLTQFVLLS